MPREPVVLITGCSTGIGRATAQRLAAKDFTVYATARSLADVKDLKAAGAKTLALDVCDDASMAAAVAAVKEAEGRIDALVNNAGYSQSGAVEDVGAGDVRRQFETNVFGLLEMCRLVLPTMREQGSGRIVNISSIGGKLTFPGGGVYHASKHAVEALSDALRFEVRGWGIGVVVVEPGLIRTEFGEAVASSIAQGTDHTGPYAGFNAAVAMATKDAYESGPLAMLGAGPDRVAKVIEKALVVRRPRIRYRVTPSARLLLGIRALLSDRAWDAFVGSQYPSPSKLSDRG